MKRRLKNVLNFNNGILKRLYNTYEYDFLTDVDTAESLDTEYILCYSGDKHISPLIDKLLDEETGELNESAYTVIMRIINANFGVKWSKLYDAINTEYNPLENYSMEETETPNITRETKEKTDVTIETESNANTDTYGFNSTSPAPTGETSSDGKSRTKGEADDNVITEKETGTKTLTRAGNIGVTTSQQMLESEYKVREYNFIKTIYNDLDTIMCLDIY